MGPVLLSAAKDLVALLVQNSPNPTRTGLVILNEVKDLVALLVRQKSAVEVTTRAIIIFLITGLHRLRDPSFRCAALRMTGG